MGEDVRLCTSSPDNVNRAKGLELRYKVKVGPGIWVEEVKGIVLIRN